jgi:hypothetical protein
MNKTWKTMVFEYLLYKQNSRYSLSMIADKHDMPRREVIAFYNELKDADEIISDAAGGYVSHAEETTNS